MASTHDFRSRIVLMSGSPTLPQLCYVEGCVSVFVLGFISPTSTLVMLYIEQSHGKMLQIPNVLAQEKLTILLPALQIIFCNVFE